ncbi:hypothetical protein [Flavobacterium hydrophilum]|uniref:Uncharacterized protein n=1 Tax=Flavobacterium hydrophilum TaxID=2211445 RepID=A0A2V4BZI9_9FLAO|nr:hypothetical protein [Flavobacterium hydrophilum]PXY44486.1 hypothetical protein DMB68_13540 [Flavobacterium hydrophilum]
MKEILIPNEFKNKIIKEFKSNRPSVRSALKFFSNSDTAKAMRKRAKELLQEELKKISEFED